MSTEATFFYAHPGDFDGTGVRLREDESHHLSRVLRLRAGDEIQVVDGIGGWYRVSLESVDRSGARGNILERRMGVGEPPVYLHLAVGAMKSRSRFDMVLEKGTELGMSRLTVVHTLKSEVARVDEGRASRVMRAAMKQCRRSRMPVVDGPVALADLLSSVGSPARIICHDGDGSVPVSTLADAGVREVVALVGPEAGFADAEVAQCVAAGFRPASLGTRRLRTETACIVVCASFVHI